VDLGSVATELYGLRPEEFTRTRNDRAKAARAEGDRALADAIGRLRRPSAAAWVVNMLARAHPEDVERVVDLGAALRQAQQDRDGDALRELNRRRQGVLSDVAARARDLAETRGQRVSASVGTEVEQTLWAAMTDEAAAAAVRSGVLTAPLATTGLGPVDVTGAVAVPSAVPAPGEQPETPREGTPRRRPVRALTEARERATEAEHEAALAEETAAGARRRVDEARARRDELGAEIEDLGNRLRWAHKQAERADRELAGAEREHEQAEREASRARGAAEKARSRADRLEDGQT
jgi:hypothetical protein